MDTLIDRIDAIKGIFEFLDIEWVEPYETTQGAIKRQEVDTKIQGMYYFYENNFYVGIASTGNIWDRHKTHRPKFDVDLNALWKGHWAFSDAWQDGVRKYYLAEDPGPIPFKMRKNKDHYPYPEGFNFPVKHNVNTDDIKVLIWDLSHLRPWEIEMIEKIVIYKLWPYTNDESYKKRQYEEKAKAKEEQMAT